MIQDENGRTSDAREGDRIPTRGQARPKSGVAMAKPPSMGASL